MNIYALYQKNGNRAGFWVQHRTWTHQCALVRMIGGRDSGPLPGRAPLFEDAPVEIGAFDVRSGRPLKPEFCAMDPFSQAFALIAQPPWSHKIITSPSPAQLPAPARPQNPNNLQSIEAVKS